MSSGSACGARQVGSHCHSPYFTLRRSSLQPRQGTPEPVDEIIRIFTRAGCQFIGLGLLPEEDGSELHQILEQRVKACGISVDDLALPFPEVRIACGEFASEEPNKLIGSVEIELPAVGGDVGPCDILRIRCRDATLGTGEERERATRVRSYFRGELEQAG